jgi:aryl-alcohol dehydrogenase-like predicted oxidoreductase
MDIVRLGKTGMRVSKLCLGCVTYGSPKWRDWVLDAGHRLGSGRGDPQARQTRRRRRSGRSPRSSRSPRVLSKPYVTAPIIGASKPNHLADAVAATGLKLDARTIAKLEEPYQPKAVTGHE